MVFVLRKFWSRLGDNQSETMSPEHIHRQIHRHMHMCEHIYTYTYTCVRTHQHTYTHVRKYAHTQISFKWERWQRASVVRQTPLCTALSHGQCSGLGTVLQPVVKCTQKYRILSVWVFGSCLSRIPSWTTVFTA